MKTRHVLKLLRLKHWTKSSFVLAPLLFSFKFDLASLISALAATIVFCLAASAVYVGNDIVDRDSDRAHPQKRDRPIACGQVTVSQAVVLMVAVAALSLAISSAISSLGLLIVAGYLVLNVLYSIWLKHTELVDVFVIALGFVLRIVLGAVAIRVVISHWLVIDSIFLSLFLGFSKRYNEAAQTGGSRHKKVLGIYTPEVLRLYMVASGVLAIVIYTLYTIDPSVQTRFDSTKLVLTVPVVVFGIYRYLLVVIAKNQGGEVAEVLFKDTVLMISILVWVGMVVWAFRW